MTPHKCPVCGGTGKVPNIGDGFSTATVPCPAGCKNGVLWQQWPPSHDDKIVALLESVVKLLEERKQ